MREEVSISSSYHSNGGVSTDVLTNSVGDAECVKLKHWIIVIEIFNVDLNLKTVALIIINM